MRGCMRTLLGLCATLCVVGAVEVLVADLRPSGTGVTNPLSKIDAVVHKKDREKKAIKRALKQDKEHALQDLARSISKREQRTDAASLYEAAEGEITHSLTSNQRLEETAHKAMELDAQEAKQALQNADTEHALEALESQATTAGSKSHSRLAKHNLGSAQTANSAAPDESSLEQLSQRAADAEKDSSMAEAQAEEAHLDKVAADQLVDRVAASKKAAEAVLEQAETKHLSAVKAATKAQRIKQTSESAATLAASRADAAAKVLEDHAVAQMEQEQDLKQMLAKKSAETRHARAAAVLSAERKLHEAGVKAHATELAARLKAVTQESEAQLNRARRHAALEVETAKHVEDSRMNTIKSTVANRIEAAKHKELVQQHIAQELKAARLQTAQATLITPAPAPVKLSAPTPAPAPLAPEEVIARLETKVDQLSDVAAQSSQSVNGVSMEELTDIVKAQEGGEEAPKDLDEEALSRLHTKLESQVNEASDSSQEERRTEEQALRAEAHFRHIEAKP